MHEYSFVFPQFDKDMNEIEEKREKIEKIGAKSLHQIRNNVR